MANYAGNIIGGAGTGAAAGAAFGPIGAGIGAGVGALTGLFSAWSQEDDEKKKRKILEKAAQEYGTSVENLKSQFETWYRENPSIGTQDDVTKFRELTTSYDPNEFVYDYEPFEDTYDINDYYAPNRSAIIQATTDAAQATAAGQGVGRGSGAVANIAQAVADKSEALARDAQTAMNQDRTFAYNLWNTNIANAQKRLDQLRSGYETQLGMYGDLAKDFQEWNAGKMQTMADLEREKMNNQLQLQLGLASI